MRLLAVCAALLALASGGALVAAAHDAGGPTSAGDIPSRAATGYVAPLDALELVRGFEPPLERWGAGHRGVDLVAKAGQPVHSPGAGTVTFAGTVAGRGVVTVAHPDGLRSSMEPVSANVTVGEHVEAGGELGEVGPTAGHCAPVVCLHWGVRDGETYVNPLRLVRSGPVVLLPGP